MSIKLYTIATINSGVYAKQARGEDLLYFQSSQFDEHGDLVDGAAMTVEVEPRLQRFLLQRGDILFSAKGMKNRSIVYQEKWGKGVASTTFLVIRPDRRAVSPEYLAWFLNHPRTQQYLKGEAKGVNPPSISIETIKRLDVELPDLQMQHDIVTVHSLRIREWELLRKIEALKDEMLQHHLLQSSKR